MRKNICIALFFLIAALIITYPLVFKFTSCIPAFFSTDESFGSLWDSWRIKFSLLHHISVTKIDMVAYPFGLNMYASEFISYFWVAIIYVLSFFTTPVISFNLQSLFNIWTMGFFCYLLVYALTKNRAGAIFSGLAYAFCPYEFSRLWQHLGLTYNQWIPLVFLALAVLMKDRTKNAKIFLFISLLLAFAFDFSVMFFTFLAILVFIVYYAINARSDLSYLKSVFSTGFLAFLVFLPQFFPIIINRIKLSSATLASASNFYHRPFEDLFAQSARPLSYFLPAAVHPLFGNFTERFIGTSLYGASYTEHTLYLGWTTLALAFIAFRAWIKKDKVLSAEQRFYIGFFLVLALAGWLFSQPPWWSFGNLKIFMPSFFIYKALPMFRAYCRFGIIVMFAAAVLAGFGLKIIMERFSSKGIKYAVAVLFCGLILFEFWNYPPFKILDVSKVPAVYYWLKDQPGDFAIAEYPMDTGGANELYKYYQSVHGKKIINGTVPGTEANLFAQRLKDLSSGETVAELKKIPVKYILVHKQDYLESDLLQDREELIKINSNPRLILVKSFLAQECPQEDIMCLQKTGPIDVYKVAPPKSNKEL